MAGARAPAPRRASAPHFQLIQSFQELSGAVSHGQSPAELGVEGFVHFGLYFGLSHGGESDGGGRRAEGASGLRAVNSARLGSARLGSARLRPARLGPPDWLRAGLLLGGDFLTWASGFLHSLLSEGSRGDGNSCFTTEVRGTLEGLDTPVQMLGNSASVLVESDVLILLVE